jgi:hypothetical protein
MKVLVFGHRLGIARSLEKKGIAYILWTASEVKNKLKALEIIVEPFPESPEILSDKIKNIQEVTHIIAGVESSVIVASQTRAWLDLKRNPHNVILKCTDKLRMKRFLVNKGIPTTSFLKAVGLEAKEVIAKLGLPLVAKERLSSGGRGVEFLQTEAQVGNCIGNIELYFEKAITGTEGSIESFISESNILFTSTTEYYKNGLCNKVPSRYSKDIKDKILELNQQVITAMNIKWGMTHLEYYITEDKILFGEIALRPPGGYLMDTLSYCYDDNFWDKFVEVETGEVHVSFKSFKNFSSSIIIYPSEGKIISIEGIEKVKSLPSFKHLKLNLEVGQLILKREGVGQDFGHAFLSNSDSKQLDHDIDMFYDSLKIQTK